MRVWEEHEGDRWLLCVPFGPKDFRRRMGLIPHHDGWSLEWYEDRGSGEAWRRVGPMLDETDGFVKDVSGAQRWALTALAVVARDRAERYARQTYSLMSEIVRDAYPDG